MNSDVMRLLSGLDKVSSVPMVYTQLDEAIHTSRVSAGHISGIISQDTGLTARMLRIVNSAFYSFPRKIDTISRAVIIAGTQQLRDLALATSILDTFSDVDEQHITVDSFWRHSIACGIASRVIASYFKEPNIERYFVAGILHDIGRLVIITRAPAKASAIFEQAALRRAPLYKLEQEILGFDHAVVGSQLINLWQLPKSFEEVILYHHLPQQATLFKKETAVVHLADAIVHAMQLGHSGESYVPPLCEDSWAVTGLPLDLLPYIMDLVDKQYEDAVKGFLRH